VNGKQENDPRKLASALVKLVNDNQPPFRFIAVADAVKVIEDKLLSMK
jgi:hypothetical protein